jgi:hypothetical protein
MLFTLLIGNIQVILKLVWLCFIHLWHVAKTGTNICQLILSLVGILAFCDGKEEEDAITLSGLGMVDEKETAAISTKTTG